MYKLWRMHAAAPSLNLYNAFMGDWVYIIMSSFFFSFSQLPYNIYVGNWYHTVRWTAYCDKAMKFSFPGRVTSQKNRFLWKYQYAFCDVHPQCRPCSSSSPCDFSYNQLSNRFFLWKMLGKTILCRAYFLSFFIKWVLITEDPSCQDQEPGADICDRNRCCQRAKLPGREFCQPSRAPALPFAHSANGIWAPQMIKSSYKRITAPEQHSSGIKNETSASSTEVATEDCTELQKGWTRSYNSGIGEAITSSSPELSCSSAFSLWKQLGEEVTHSNSGHSMHKTRCTWH